MLNPIEIKPVKEVQSSQKNNKTNTPPQKQK
jgi:hypothetical protein